jgi:hypothetical protein
VVFDDSYFGQTELSNFICTKCAFDTLWNFSRTFAINNLVIKNLLPPIGCAPADHMGIQCTPWPFPASTTLPQLLLLQPNFQSVSPIIISCTLDLLGVCLTALALMLHAGQGYNSGVKHKLWDRPYLLYYPNRQQLYRCMLAAVSWYHEILQRVLQASQLLGHLENLRAAAQIPWEQHSYHP